VRKRARGGLIWGQAGRFVLPGDGERLDPEPIASGPRSAFGLSRDCSALCRQMGKGCAGRIPRIVVGVWTVCYGETKGVKAWRSLYQGPQCDAMLARELISYRTQFWHRYFLARDAWPAGLPGASRYGFTQALAYNVGVGGAGGVDGGAPVEAGDIAGGTVRAITLVG